MSATAPKHCTCDRPIKIERWISMGRTECHRCHTPLQSTYGYATGNYSEVPVPVPTKQPVTYAEPPLTFSPDNLPNDPPNPTTTVFIDAD